MISLYDSALDAAAAIRAKETSATELLEQAFDRLDRVDPQLNAIVWQDRDAARARARAADRGEAAGPLHGVPITIKESFAYRGSPNAWGVPQLKDAISAHTAIAVQRLESAGAVIVGKTNVPVMLGDWQSYNPIHGATNNPWDVTRTAGGSTGGGAAALAAGIGFLTLGTDIAGSIRVPSHFCGVYGHKPSLNLVNTDGLQPGPWDGLPGWPMDVAVVGPMARTARDLALALEVLGGPSRDDAKGWTWRMPPPRRTRLADFRIGCILDDPAAPVASDVRAVYDNVIGELERAGATIARGWPESLDVRAQLETFQFLTSAMMNAAGEQKETYGRWLQETQRRLAIRAVWEKFFESHDVFLLPTAFTAAFPHDHSEPMGKRTIATPEGARPYLALPFWITFASLAGVPATTAPVGLTKAGLPVGIQILAPMWEDATSIEFAALLAERIGGFAQPPAFAESS